MEAVVWRTSIAIYLPPVLPHRTSPSFFLASTHESGHILRIWIFTRTSIDHKLQLNASQILPSPEASPEQLLGDSKEA
jgi:hypothetical protein